MKKIFFLILILTFLFSVIFNCPADDKKGVVYGNVQDKNLKSLEGVQVTVVGTEFVCPTDSTGFFIFDRLEPGNYTLSFVLTGYMTKTQTVNIPEGIPRIMAVQMDAIATVDVANGSVDLIYVTHLGTVNKNYEYEQDNPWGTGSIPDTSGWGINELYLLTYKWDPLSQYYQSSNNFLKSAPTEEELQTFIQYFDKKRNNLMVINSATKGPVSIVESWQPEIKPQWLDMNDKGVLFLADSANNISVYNTGNGLSQITTMNMGEAIWDIAVGNSGSRLFCCLGNLSAPSIGVIDTNSYSYITSITLPRMKNGDIGQPWGIATHKTGNTAYVATGNDIGGEVIAINTVTNSVISTVTVGQFPFGLDVTPDGKKVYVANMNSGSVSVIDTVKNQVIATINVGPNPVKVAITPDGTKALVTCKNEEGIIIVINTLTDTVWTAIPVGKEPVGVAITGDGKRAYVANSRSDNISIIDLSLNSVMGNTIPFPGGTPFDISVR